MFFDRDGVINRRKKDYVKSVEELKIFSDVAKCVKRLKEFDFLIVIVTNQSAINRGYTSHKNVEKIHSTIQNYLTKNGTAVDKFYYCPHRPDENCECRKPNPGLLIKAINELDIDPSQSWIIGDNETDLIAGEKVGCSGILLDDNHNLQFAVKTILQSQN